ncbi:MAG TPA: P-type conjugative transfer protein TrbG [Bacillota bacterium]|jgi:P-type conjugative transfer protein TrbG|nr:P-type conjugative transfer protein TrbG [Bacillota bacterium]HOL09913.1 P-type conjugative transfer protein TrbG [Bacillota bacterium]HPO98131.1 P-type conjugative transfer protein TrbG [Bacillota bacterium]
MGKKLLVGLLIGLLVFNVQIFATNEGETTKEPETNVITEDTPLAGERNREAKNATLDNVKKNTQDIPDAIAKQADFAFTYIPNQIYKVYCQAERLTDIQLQPGEEILFIGAGDTVRWMVDKDVSGSGSNRRWHIYIKPLRGGISTNLIINTDRRAYHLEVYASNWYTPIVNWVYPQDEKMALARQQAEQFKFDKENIIVGEGTGKLSPEELNFKYKILGGNYKWKPTMVFDDGLKTYLKMPETMVADEAPVLFIKDGKKLLLVNYRVKNGYYIVDRLFKEAVLRVGKKNVTIKNLK